jgi:hypothetical protein
VCFWVFCPDRKAWARSWWVACGIFALLIVLGDPAYLWNGLAALPMSKFFLRYSFRFYPWLAFFAILSGGVILERVLAMVRQRRWCEPVLGGAMLCVLAHHVAMCELSFYSYGFRPYPALPGEFEATFHPGGDPSRGTAGHSGRLASWSQLRSPAPDFYASLPLNLPHYYRVPSIFGYDPVIEGQPRVAAVYRWLEADPVATCTAYGVGWHLFSYSDTPVLSPNKRFYGVERSVPFEPAYRRLLKENLALLAQAGGTSLKELKGVDPLAFAGERAEHALPLQLHCRGADIDVRGLPAGTPVTINFLRYPQMAILLDGVSLSVGEDEWQRIKTTLPQAGSTLSLRYQPPWHETCGAGAILCLAALILAWGIFRFRFTSAGPAPAQSCGTQPSSAGTPSE